MLRATFSLPAFAALIACGPGGDAGRMVVFGLDQPPAGRLDQTVCAVGVGLQLDLGFEQTIAYDVDARARSALLASCQLGAGGAVLSCGYMQPAVELRVEDQGIVGQAMAGVTLDDACSSADIALDYLLMRDGDQLRTQIDATWSLPNSAACEDFERRVRESSDNGGGVSGCTVRYDFEAVRIATCDFDSFGAPCFYD